MCVRQAVAARTGDWSTGSSTSSGKEDRKPKNLEAEIKELRARLEVLEKEGRGRSPRRAGLSIQERESGMEVEWGMDMDVEDEIESRAEGVATY